MQPDLTVSRTYTSPMCFQDSIDKELMAERSLLDPLPDLKVKGQEIQSFWKTMCVAVDSSWKKKLQSYSGCQMKSPSLSEPVFKEAILQKKEKV